MDRLILNGTDGFPLYTDTLAEAQKGWSVFNGLTGLAGDFAIIKGCEITGSQVSDGYVSIGGELYFFKGGSLGTNVIIKEIVTKREFKDKSSKPVYMERYATFGSSTPDKTFAWANFKRVKNLMQIEAEKVANTLFNQKMAEINQSITTLQSLITAAKQNADNIKKTMEDHIANTDNPHAVRARQVDIKKVGTLYIGDVQNRRVGDQWHTWGGAKIQLIEKGSSDRTFGGDDKYRVTFQNENFGSSYVLLANVTSVDSRKWNNDNDVILTTGNKQYNSFELYLREVSTNVQDIMIDYIIIRKPQD